MRSETLALSPTFSVEFSMAFISIQGAADCYNKSTAVYNLQGFHFPLLFLHNFLFDAWHKLYENDIEYREFIAKVIVQMSLSNPTRATNLQPALEDRVSDPKVVADALLTTAEIHRYLATEVENVLARAESIMDHPLDQNPERAGSDGLLYRSAPRFYHLHPLFRALVIVAAEYSFEEHRTRYRDDFWQQPVYLLRTVHTKGLSAPIDFAPLALGKLYVSRTTRRARVTPE